MKNVLCKAKCGGLKWVGIGILLGGALVFLTSCGTARGVLTGMEATGGGIIQDLRGAVDGINWADHHESNEEN